MAITKVSPDVVNFDSALVVSPTLTIGDATAEDTKIVFDGNAQDYYIGLDDSADDLIIGLGSTVGTTPAIIIDENLNIGIGATPNYGKVNITTTGTGAQDRALWVECSPASSGSNNNAMVINVGNANMTNTVMRIHHESPAADQKLLSLDTTGSNTEKFWVDKDGDIYLEGNLGLNESTPTSYYTKTLQINGSGASSAIKLTNTATGNANNRGHDIASDSADMRLANREANGHWQVYTTAVTDSPQLAIDVTEDQEVLTPKQPSFLVRNSQNNGLDASSNAYTVRYGGHSVLHNIGSHFDTTNYKFVAPVAGVYFFSANLRVDGFAGNYSYLTLKHYSSTNVQQSDKGRDLQDGNNSTYLNHVVTAVVNLAINDYVYMEYIANGDTSVNLDSDSWFSGYLIG